MQNSSTLFIDLEAIRTNLKVIARRLPGTRIMAMVKANAYGTDSLRLSKFLQSCGVTILGVSHVDEGVYLRENGVTLPIFVISAPPFEAEKAVRFHLEVAVSTFEEVDALARISHKPFGRFGHLFHHLPSENPSEGLLEPSLQGSLRHLAKQSVQIGSSVCEKYGLAHIAHQKIPVHLHINTGMNRFGVSAEKALELAHYINKQPALTLEGAMTHFAAAGLPQFDSFTQKQMQTFQSLVEKLDPQPRWIHAANSPAALRFNFPFCNLVRIGVALFGLGCRSEELKCALSLESHLVSIITCRKGETIGYECAFPITREKMRIGVISMGYHDGLHRHYAGKGHVLIHGKQAPLVGNICMDFMMVDLTEIPEARVGDNVVLPIEKFAEWGETNVREVIACLGPRVKRMEK